MTEAWGEECGGRKGEEKGVEQEENEEGKARGEGGERRTRETTA